MSSSKVDFGAKVKEAREAQKISLTQLACAIHAGRCDVQHEGPPYRWADLSKDCQKAANEVYYAVWVIEKGSDPTIEAELAHRLKLNSRGKKVTRG